MWLCNKIITVEDTFTVQTFHKTVKKIHNSTLPYKSDK